MFIPSGSKTHCGDRITKWKITVELVKQARENNVHFGCAGIDCLFEHNNKFLNTLEDRGEKFVAYQRFWIEDSFHEAKPEWSISSPSMAKVANTKTAKRANTT